MQFDANQSQPPYRGRLAPTPTGYLHLGHAATFSLAAQRTRDAQGILVYRDEDIDPDRCKPEFSSAAIEDLAWWGLTWDEGPDIGGPCGPYCQSQRLERYREAWDNLRKQGSIYPSGHSRKDIQQAEPALGYGGEPVFPPSLRPERPDMTVLQENEDRMNWRFRVPDGRRISFYDARLGKCSFTAGRDFGDFLVWRKVGVPSYELAVVVDDIAMDITEVVRGTDLLISTARQILLYEALGAIPPAWYHAPLIVDAQGLRLAKRHASLSLRHLREEGFDPRSPLDSTLARLGFHSAGDPTAS